MRVGLDGHFWPDCSSGKPKPGSNLLKRFSEYLPVMVDSISCLGINRWMGLILNSLKTSFSVLL